MAAVNDSDALSPLDRWLTWERRIHDAKIAGNMRIVAAITRDQLREIDLLIQNGEDAGMSKRQLLQLYRDINEEYRQAMIADPIRNFPHAPKSFIPPDPKKTIGGSDRLQVLSTEDFAAVVSNCLQNSGLHDAELQDRPVLRLAAAPGTSARSDDPGGASCAVQPPHANGSTYPSRAPGGSRTYGAPGVRDRQDNPKRIRYDSLPNYPGQNQHGQSSHSQRRWQQHEQNQHNMAPQQRYKLQPPQDMTQPHDTEAEHSERPLGGPTSFKTARQQLSIDKKKHGGRGGCGGGGGGSARRGGGVGYDRHGDGEDGRHNYYSTGPQQGSRGGRASGGLGLSRPQRRANNPQYQVPVKRSDGGHADDGGRGYAGPVADNGSAEHQAEKSLKGVEDKLVELIRNEIMDHNPGVEWDDVAGLEYAKETIQETLIWPMINPEVFKGLRSGFKGLLLFGPPGTGKTLIGKCIASQCKSTFFCISASSLTSKWVGEGEKLVRTLFAVAREHLPAVIFIDEIDSLLTKRSENENEGSRRIKTEFLVQLDGANTSKAESLLIVGATNRPQELDEAARRRLAKRVYIALPTAAAREQMVTRLLKDCRNSIGASDMSEIIKRSDGYSGSDLANLCKDAALGPLRALMRSSGGSKKFPNIKVEDVPPVTLKDFDSAFSRVRASVHQSELDAYVSWNEQFGSGA
eukprot:m.1306314 g.1306314  ORF g.1306314 m.1306314 type:complete len:689 (+) comp24815_c1_seq29:255-2321(+)